MEHFVVLIAATLAGVGTGLVGLSAATAMVPLLIVLCPTFQGEHGAYMATAIALASDILGSAVTTAVYAKNKNIDLKHGWLMTVCVISMCAIGSIAAYFTRQQVLGGFSLFLCVAIGIRFLVKPDSKEKSAIAEQKKLTVKQIAVSLFFGLTIGFGTGFFGSGGGMMMLIVFTAMLGYDRKSAVGTSTFIMTFTALIASISHILIEPAILLECWDYLALAIVTATFFSLVSARFANRVNARVVGYVTGAILLILGLTLVFLNYKDQIQLPPAVLAFLSEFGRLFFLYLAYLVVFASSLIILRYTVKIPDYIFRKMLHIVAFTSVLPLILWTEDWRAAVAVEGVFLIIIIFALHFFEHFHFYSNLFVEKRPHEVITSFVLLFGMITAMLAVFWGGFGDSYAYIAVASLMAWGPGDAAAAIVGKNWGKHKLSGPHIEGKKSVEGTLAMGITSLICTFVTLLCMSGLTIPEIVITSLIIAPIAALVELFTKHGLDTVTVPIVSSIVLGIVILL